MAQLILGIIIGGVIGFAILVLCTIAKEADERTDIEELADKLDQYADACADYGDMEFVPGLRAAADCIRTWV